MTDRQALGAAGERAAARFLRRQGYRLLERNFSTAVGEIDIIAGDGETLCFVEVKTRASGEFAPPHASVGRRKQSRMRAAASAYLAAKGLHDRLCRFDVVSLVPAPDAKPEWEIELLRDAF
jgi:putative endonuclease